MPYWTALRYCPPRRRLSIVKLPLTRVVISEPKIEAELAVFDEMKEFSIVKWEEPILQRTPPLEVA